MFSAPRLARVLRRSLLSLCVLAAVPLSAQPVNVNFDDLPPTADNFLPSNLGGCSGRTSGT
jgi:hypothetical protein